MGNKLLAVAVLDQFYADGLGTLGMAIGSAEWFAWLDQPEHSAFAYHAHDVAITVRRTNGVWGAWRRSGEQRHVKKVYLGLSANLTVERLEAAALRLADPATPDPREVLRTSVGRNAFTTQLDDLAARLEQRGYLGRKDARSLVRLARQAFTALDPASEWAFPAQEEHA